jgi:hypothetical protein
MANLQGWPASQGLVYLWRLRSAVFVIQKSSAVQPIENFNPAFRFKQYAKPSAVRIKELHYTLRNTPKEHRSHTDQLKI